MDDKDEQKIDWKKELYLDYSQKQPIKVFQMSNGSNLSFTLSKDGKEKIIKLSKKQTELLLAKLVRCVDTNRRFELLRHGRWRHIDRYSCKTCGETIHPTYCPSCVNKSCRTCTNFHLLPQNQVSGQGYCGAYPKEEHLYVSKSDSKDCKQYELDPKKECYMRIEGMISDARLAFELMNDTLFKEEWTSLKTGGIQGMMDVRHKAYTKFLNTPVGELIEKLSKYYQKDLENETKRLKR